MKDVYKKRVIIGKLLASTKGSSMTEVLVAFLMLVIIMGMFGQVVNTTNNMVTASRNTFKARRNLAGDYYMGRITPEADPVFLEFEDEISGKKFTIPANLRTFQGELGILYDVEGNKKKTP